MGRGVIVLAAVGAVALAGGLAIGIARYGDAADPAALSALTRTELRDLAGATTTLEAWRGKVLVVNFWASWCAPCREEIPGLVRIQQRFASNSVQVVGIAIDSEVKAREAAAEMGIRYPVLVGNMATVDATRRLGNRPGALPYTLVLDRDGQVVTSHLGILREDELERLLAPLLSRKA